MGQCIVFCNSHASLDLLDQFVKKNEDMEDTKVLVLHGRLGTSARKKVHRNAFSCLITVTRGGFAVLPTD